MEDNHGVREVINREASSEIKKAGRFEGPDVARGGKGEVGEKKSLVGKGKTDPQKLGGGPVWAGPKSVRGEMTLTGLGVRSAAKREGVCLRIGKRIVREGLDVF